MKQVVLPYDPEWEPLYWAKQNCPSYITNMSTDRGEICYCFSNEKDALMFALRWI